MSIFSYPTALAPTVVKGWAEGELLRWESLTGPERATTVEESTAVKGITWDYKDRAFELEEVVPQLWDGHWYGLTHMQKYSLRGMMVTDPYCYFVWNFSKLQQRDANGGWIPKSEVGWTFRTPGRRFDVPGTKGQHWPWTWGRLGAHWD